VEARIAERRDVLNPRAADVRCRRLGLTGGVPWTAASSRRGFWQVTYARPSMSAPGLKGECLVASALVKCWAPSNGWNGMPPHWTPRSRCANRARVAPYIAPGLTRRAYSLLRRELHGSSAACQGFVSRQRPALSFTRKPLSATRRRWNDGRDNTGCAWRIFMFRVRRGLAVARLPLTVQSRE